MRNLNEVREALLNSTVRIVAQYGLERTTTKLIAADAQINEAYIYRCYDSKDSLLQATFHMCLLLSSFQFAQVIVHYRRALLNDAKKVVASFDLEAYTARELADMAEYLYGKKMYGAEKEVIISFLKQTP